MDESLRQYLAEIGRRGGKASRRELKPEAARDMVRVREARRAFRRFYHQCFWPYAPDLHVSIGDIEWVRDRLMRFGDRRAWEAAARLCR